MRGLSLETPVNSRQYHQRNWKRVILISILVGGLVGFLVSYLFQPKYTSRSLVSVRRPDGDVWGSFPIRDYQSRLAVLRERALAPNHLRPIIQRLGNAKTGEEGKTVEQIHRNVKMEPALEGNITAADNDAVYPSQIIGFNVIYTDTSPSQAEQMCNWLTSTVLEEQRAQSRKSRDNTVQFLERQAEYAKNNLETIHAQLGKRLADKGSRTAEEQASNQKLAHDYKIAQALYTVLQDKLRQMKPAAQLSTELEAAEPMQVLLPCSHPDSADSPNRWLFAGVGLLTGLLLAVGFLLL